MLLCLYTCYTCYASFGSDSNSILLQFQGISLLTHVSAVLNFCCYSVNAVILESTLKGTTRCEHVLKFLQGQVQFCNLLLTRLSFKASSISLIFLDCDSRPVEQVKYHKNKLLFPVKLREFAAIYKF